MKRIFIGLATGFFAVVSLNGCVAVRSNHGYALERGEEGLDAKVGLDTKESVLARYGEPSMIGTFDQNAWYYMTSFDTARAFFRPKTQRREIIAFHFDDEGVVSEVGQYDLEDGLDVGMISRVTPTRGKELTFWEQLLGNVGQLPAATGQGPQGPQ